MCSYNLTHDIKPEGITDIGTEESGLKRISAEHNNKGTKFNGDKGCL